MIILFKQAKLFSALFFLLIVTLMPGTFREAFAQGSSQPSANAPLNLKVTATIRPLHSIATAIMKGVGVPTLLLEASQSSHHASLRPSQAKALYASDVIFWIGPGLEAFLTKPLGMQGDNSQVIALSEDSSLDLLQLQDGTTDPHIWLSPKNAILMAQIIKSTLAASDPANMQIYEENFQQLENEFLALQDRLAQLLSAVDNKKFLIYHDALGYLEDQFKFQTRPVGVGNAELTPGARQIAEIGRLARSGEYQCILVEPNANATAVINAAKETGLPVAPLDPIGATLKVGAELYSELMLELTQTIVNCAK